MNVDINTLDTIDSGSQRFFFNFERIGNQMWLSFFKFDHVSPILSTRSYVCWLTVNFFGMLLLPVFREPFYDP